jgi:hypothetical protein
VEVIERALNHVSGSYAGVSGTYQRDPMTAEVKAALERWAAHVAGVVAGKLAKVVALRGAGYPRPKVHRGNSVAVKEEIRQ